MCVSVCLAFVNPNKWLRFARLRDAAACVCANQPQTIAMGLSGSYAPNIPDKVHTDLMDAQRRKMLESLDSLKKDEKTREYADLIEIMTTMWCDQ